MTENEAAAKVSFWNALVELIKAVTELVKKQKVDD
jgi:hypothetical protein